MSIINFIEEYKKSKRTLFTTPSHSQGDFIVPQSEKYLGHRYFKHDYSEIDGFDNLSCPKGIIKSAQEYAANIYDAKSTFFLTNGSTSGILAAMYALIHRGDKVLIARNCHKSVFNGLVLTGAIPIWIMPSYNQEWGIFETVNIDLLDETLKKNRDVKVFILTNPTYEGVMTDIYKVSDVCKRYNVKLIVDEAHGALWNFHKSIGTPSILQGADIVVQSLHKTAGAINPSALLHIGKDSTVDPKTVQEALNIFNTSSPSYPLLINIEATINYLISEKGKNHLFEMMKNISRLIRVLKTIPNLSIYSDRNDTTKILVKVTNMSGFELSDILFNKYNIEDELANDKSVLLLTGLGTTKSKLKKIEKVLLDLCSNNIKITEDKTNYSKYIPIEPRVRYIPALIWNNEYKEVELKYALSRICMEVIADYPPGIPVLLPGEVIKREHIEYLASTRSKIKVLL